jgi:zinc transport system substrate-binding protein
MDFARTVFKFKLFFMTKKTISQITIFSLVILAIVASIIAVTYLNPTKTTVKAPSLNESPNLSTSKIKVATSFYPLQFLAQEIGKELAEVKNITPAGSEPHEYEPTQQQIIEISQSDILLSNGAGLESWTTKLAQGNTVPKTILELSKSFQLSEIEEEGKKVQDPHIWLSPKNYIIMAKVISSVMQQNQTPTNQLIIQKNTESLLQKLDVLELNYEIKLGNKNCKNNKFVTNHDAFNYLAKDYGLEALSISGLSPEAEPTTKELADLSETIKANNIKYVLTETIASPKLSETLAKEVGITTLAMNPLEGLSQEELSLGKNYINIMESNLQSLALALECK